MAKLHYFLLFLCVQVVYMAPANDQTDEGIRQNSELEDDEKIRQMFDQFIDQYKRRYSKNPASETYRYRFEIFKKNLKTIEELRKTEKGTATYGITKFMDYSRDEYRRFLAPGLSERLYPIQEAKTDDLNLDKIPASMDWRNEGVVTAVKDQGDCGSCWSFSTTGNIEGQWAIQKNQLISLSEQELVDCDRRNSGCNGGLPWNAYKSVRRLGGLETESAYPYTGTDDQCQLDQSQVEVYINDSVRISTNERVQAAWLAKYGPMSTALNADTLEYYTGGIAHPSKFKCDPEGLNHAVLTVGYGEENNTPYWIIKNSWGPGWGENGYFRMYRGDGTCGINAEATSSIVD